MSLTSRLNSDVYRDGRKYSRRAVFSRIQYYNILVSSSFVLLYYIYHHPSYKLNYGIIIFHVEDDLYYAKFLSQLALVWDTLTFLLETLIIQVWQDKSRQLIR